MKIGVDIRCLTEKYYSGISQYTNNLVKNLLAIDLKNQYFLFYNSAKPAKVPIFNQSNVRIKEFQYPNKLFNLALKFFKIVDVDKLIGGVDLFIMPNFLFINLSNQCRKLIIVHDLS